MYNNENEIKHTRNKMVCTSFDRLTTEPAYSEIGLTSRKSKIGALHGGEKFINAWSFPSIIVLFNSYMTIYIFLQMYIAIVSKYNEGELAYIVHRSM